MALAFSHGCTERAGMGDTRVKEGIAKKTRIAAAAADGACKMAAQKRQNKKLAFPIVHGTGTNSVPHFT